MTTDHLPAHVTALARHFADLRDGTHGNADSRADKETLFATAVGLLDRYAREALAEVNTHLLLDTGTVTATGPRPSSDGGTEALWSLSWLEQCDTGVHPVTLRASTAAGSTTPTCAVPRSVTGRSTCSTAPMPPPSYPPSMSSVQRRRRTAIR